MTRMLIFTLQVVSQCIILHEFLKKSSQGVFFFGVEVTGDLRAPKGT